ncbi:MAG: hypothetical protein AAGN82_21300 [Myxococcota bacterium]
MLQRLAFGDIEVIDVERYRHVAEAARLLAAARALDLRFAMVEAGGPGEDEARLINLAFWHPDGVAEVLDEPYLTLDQVAHNVWHVAAARALGEEATRVEGLLLAEAVASAFDVYLIGRLLGHEPEAPLLETQVPAMSDAAGAAGRSDAEVAAMFEGFAAAPEESFGQLTQLLFATGRALVDAPDPDAAAEVLRHSRTQPLGCLLHHYELPTWVLFARAYGTEGHAPAAAALAENIERSSDPVTLLCDAWLP